ncbi:putative RING-H2 finger protein ATL78-like [Capsicum annuum]|nr:putative RING-H2 finger protein ATL78-like [Capsicum annuum]
MEQPEDFVVPGKKNKGREHDDNGKSHHIQRRYNTVRELLSSGIITVEYVKSKDNLSDPFTKGLSKEGMEKSSKGIGLKPRKSQRGVDIIVFKELGLEVLTIDENCKRTAQRPIMFYMPNPYNYRQPIGSKLVKLNIYCIGTNGDQPGRFGGVFQDHEGKWLARYKGNIDTEDDVTTGLVALRLGMAAWKERKWKAEKLIGDSDNFMLVQNANGLPEPNENTKYMLREILDLLKFRICAVYHVYKETNEAARNWALKDKCPNKGPNAASERKLYKWLNRDKLESLQVGVLNVEQIDKVEEHVVEGQVFEKRAILHNTEETLKLIRLEKKADSITRGIIVSSVIDDLIHECDKFSTANAIWAHLAETYGIPNLPKFDTRLRSYGDFSKAVYHLGNRRIAEMGISVTCLRQLTIKFDTYKKRYDMNIKQYLRVMSNMITHLKSAGHILSDEQQVQAVI